MKKKILVTATLCTALLTGVLYGFASTSGTEANPLISQVFLDGEYKENVLNSGLTKANEELEDTFSDATSGLDGGDTGQFSYKTVNSGDSATLSFGGSILITSGSATIAVTEGEVININDGSVVSDGNLKTNNRYFATEDAAASVKFTSLSEIMVEGDVAVSSTAGAVNTFTDVRPTDWFYADVMSAVEMGLINGMDETTFNPEGDVNYAQALKLAACVHQYYEDGKVTLQNGDPWYKSYADYALEAGIVKVLPTNYDANVSRDQYTAMMFYALPLEEFKAINTVPEDSIPDLKSGDDWYEEIYSLYRAGIITGSDEAHTFNPYSDVKRSEVSTIIARMFDESVRKSFDLG